MNVYFKPLAQPRRKVVRPPLGVETINVGGACHECGAMPLVARGKRMRVVEDRRYESDAHCASCDAHVGKLIAVPDTLFGIEEDHRVLNGRCRVY